jgi:hypothetical protein
MCFTRSSAAVARASLLAAQISASTTVSCTRARHWDPGGVNGVRAPPPVCAPPRQLATLLRKMRYGAGIASSVPSSLATSLCLTCRSPRRVWLVCSRPHLHLGPLPDRQVAGVGQARPQHLLRPWSGRRCVMASHYVENQIKVVHI